MASVFGWGKPPSTGGSMQVGDKVKHKAITTRIWLNDTIYTVVEFEADDFVKIKHPDVPGHFHTHKKNLEAIK